MPRTYDDWKTTEPDDLFDSSDDDFEEDEPFFEDDFDDRPPRDIDDEDCLSDDLPPELDFED